MGMRSSDIIPILQLGEKRQVVPSSHGRRGKSPLFREPRKQHKTAAGQKCRLRNEGFGITSLYGPKQPEQRELRIATRYLGSCVNECKGEFGSFFLGIDHST